MATETYNLNAVVCVLGGRRLRVGNLTLTPPPANAVEAAANGTRVISKDTQTHWDVSLQLEQSSADFAFVAQLYIDYSGNEEAGPADAANEWSFLDPNTGFQLDGSYAFTAMEDLAYEKAAGQRTITGSVDPTSLTAGTGQG